MFKCINGFTKEKIKETIIKNNFNRISSSIHRGFINCLYNSEDNNRCFVGCFIPENEYSKKMEGYAADMLIKEFTNLNQYMPLDVYGLMELQKVHDEFISGNGSLHKVMIEWVDTNIED